MGLKPYPLNSLFMRAEHRIEGIKKGPLPTRARGL